MSKRESLLAKRFDEVPGYILITDPKGDILYASEGVEASTGFSVKEILGKNPGKIWGGGMDRDFYKRLWNTIEVQKGPFEGRVKNRMKSGQPRTENIHLSPIMNRQGSIEYYIEVQPNFKTQAAQKKFKEEFKHLMKKQNANTHQVLPQLLSWISEDEKDDYMAELQAFAKEYQDLPTLLNDLFLSYGEMARLEDKRLLSMVTKDPNQFERLYKKYKNRVYNYLLYRLGKNQPMAEELMQETFERAFHALKTFVLKENTYLSYLLVIAHNLLVNHYRKAPLILLEDVSAWATPIAAQSEEQDLENAEKFQQVWSFLGKCSPLEQKVMRLKYKEGWKIGDIALRLGKSENAIKLILSRTRKKMRSQLHVRHLCEGSVFIGMYDAYFLRNNPPGATVARPVALQHAADGVNKAHRAE